MSEAITIQLNGEAYTLAPMTPLIQLIEQLKLNHGRLAVEINREIIPRSEHPQCVINAGDVVEIIHAIGGG